MKGAVIYHSKWGNCRRVAESVAGGLREAGHEVTLVEIPSKEGLDSSLDFIAAGSPTRIGKMTNPMHRFLKRHIEEEWKGKPFAAFGTGMKDVREKGKNQSADGIYELLKKKGLKPVAPAFKAAVEDLQGPLADGELENALEFGKQVGASLNEGGNPGEE
jgi:menaquinone-dependent protoporphyrinogen IX oxidase